MARDLKTWSERQQVLAIIIVGGLVLFLLWFFALMPLNQKRKELEEDISRKSSELARKGLLLDQDILTRRRREAYTANRKLHTEWMNTSTRVSAFSDIQSITPGAVRHIDYKVTLFEVRQQLRKKSRALKIPLPYDLGMDASVRSSADARVLMLQLRAVEKLVDMCLDLKINTIRQITPLTSIVHKEATSSRPYMEEFPVHLEFYGSLENIYDLFGASLNPEHVFLLRNIRVESISLDNPELLKVNVVMSGLIFLVDPDAIAPKAKVKQEQSRQPMGH